MKTAVVSLFALLAIVTFVAPRPVQARIAERMEAAKGKMEDRREAREEKKEDRSDAVCEDIEERLDNKIINFDNSHKMHVRQYALMKEKIGKVILEQSAKGKNVDKLRDDLATLNTKIEKFNTDRIAFINALKTIQQYPCGDSDGAFKDAVKAAQDAHKIVLADQKDIRSFYITTIRADLKALKD